MLTQYCAYQQVLLDEQSRELATLNTHKGLFRPTRLAFGIYSAPGIFQRQMEQSAHRRYLGIEWFFPANPTALG